MNFTKYFIYFPYRITWNFLKLFRKKKQIDFLCGSIIDYICFKNIHELMPEVRIVARNKAIKSKLKEYNVDAVLYPSFPDVIIMARHLTRKYPEQKIIKIGMTHGAYNFKKLISANKYNAFDKYLFTSSQKEKEAREIGINCGVAVGYCKLDKAFQDSKIALSSYKQKLNLDSTKPTIIFTATWDKKGYSAIDQWYNKLSSLTNDYNILVTVHPWTSKNKIEIIKKTPKVHYIEDKDILPYLLISDLMIGDTSSILGEFCALNKPLITFAIPLVGRMTQETKTMLEEISFRVSSFNGLKNTIPKALKQKDLHKNNRIKYNKIMFDQLDGKASQRAFQIIKETIKRKK